MEGSREERTHFFKQNLHRLTVRLRPWGSGLFCSKKKQKTPGDPVYVAGAGGRWRLEGVRL